MNEFEITTIQNMLDEQRNTDFWIISMGASLPHDVKATSLIGAYLNTLDYYGDAPFIVFLLEKPKQSGMIFRNVFLLDPQQIPIGNDLLLVNGTFMRKCLSHQIEVKDKVINLNTYDALYNLFDSGTVRQDIAELTKEKCMLIGVYPSEIHFSRGK